MTDCSSLFLFSALCLAFRRIIPEQTTSVSSAYPTAVPAQDACALTKQASACTHATTSCYFCCLRGRQSKTPNTVRIQCWGCSKGPCFLVAWLNPCRPPLSLPSLALPCVHLGRPPTCACFLAGSALISLSLASRPKILASVSRASTLLHH